MQDYRWNRPQTSSACNQRILKQLREKRGMTQADLAEASGYSERLIVKAESGRSLSSRTIEDLADALSTSESKIFPEDLTSDPLALARKYTEALYIHQRDAVKHIGHFLDKDVVFRISGDPDKLPFAGEFRGIEALERKFQLFFDFLEVPEDHSFRECYHYVSDGTDVVIWGESWIHPIGQPLEEPMHVSNLLRFRRGKLYHFEDNFDTQYATDLITR